ncbi:hypothetical protein ECZU23_51370 [Escherichia coli]|nr:hypothetical protein ECZU23_51370 [Escherichia coli]
MTDSELMQLSEQVGQALKARGATVTTAESCTGGWVAKVITDIAGSSAWFERGFVTYSNEAKAQMIGVREETLAQRGAVSEPVVVEMAIGALKAARADYAVSISGIAGPDGGSEEKPVGTVWFAFATARGEGITGGNASAVTVMRCVVRLLRMHCRPCGNNFYKTLDTV